ncbi:MAG: hypothetical protein AAGN82_29750 [Myxococcota bacterium]
MDDALMATTGTIHCLRGGRPSRWGSMRRCLVLAGMAPLAGTWACSGSPSPVSVRFENQETSLVRVGDPPELEGVLRARLFPGNDFDGDVYLHAFGPPDTEIVSVVPEVPWRVDDTVEVTWRNRSLAADAQVSRAVELEAVLFLDGLGLTEPETIQFFLVSGP